MDASNWLVNIWAADWWPSWFYLFENKEMAATEFKQIDIEIWSSSYCSLCSFIRSAAEFFFETSCRNIIFFLQNQYFLRHKVLTEYFFCPFQGQKFFFNQICRQKFLIEVLVVKLHFTLNTTNSGARRTFS